MVGPGGDHQAHRPGVEPPEHGPRQQKALAHRPPGRHHRDRAPCDRVADRDLLRPEPAAEHLLVEPRGVVAAGVEQRPDRPQLGASSSAGVRSRSRQSTSSAGASFGRPSAVSSSGSSWVPLPRRQPLLIPGRALGLRSSRGSLYRGRRGELWAVHSRTSGVDGGSRAERISGAAECDVCLIEATRCSFPPFPVGEPRRSALGLARDGNREWKQKAPAVSGAAQFGAVPPYLRDRGWPVFDGRAMA